MDKVEQLKTEKSNVRINSLDVLKAVAIIVVSLNHTLDVTWGGFSLFQQWGYAWELFAFFFVGGVLLFHKRMLKMTLKTYIQKELKSIIWPYFTISIMYIVFGDGTGWKQTITFNGIGALWFLPTYFFASVFVFLLMKISLILTRYAQPFVFFIEGGGNNNISYFKSPNKKKIL